MALVWQQPLPPIYQTLSEPELKLRIADAKAALGSRLVILGHHYQQDEVVAFADFAGDSFELSRKAAEQQGAEFVIFAGVHFMAESADILTDPAVHVILPDLGAGCSMADMANLDQTLECWEQLTAACPDQRIVPVTYMNSTAAIKAFVGEHGGAVCTSSNCEKILKWAIEGGGQQAAGSGQQEMSEGSTSIGNRQSTIDNSTTGGGQQETHVAGGASHVDGRQTDESRQQATSNKPQATTKILFFPDQHLGRNTAFAMGYPLDSMIVWDPREDLGGNSEQAVRDAKFVLWKGHCSVHQLFRPEHVDQAREKYPGIQVIVHPECAFEVVQKADQSGSTAKIVKTIDAAPTGSIWAIGTEVHLINRLKHAHPDKTIMVLSDCQCLCTTMYRIDLPHLCWAMENLVQGKVVNEIRVDENTRKWSKVALQRMLDITAGK